MIASDVDAFGGATGRRSFKKRKRSSEAGGNAQPVTTSIGPTVTSGQPLLDAFAWPVFESPAQHHAPRAAGGNVDGVMHSVVSPAHSVTGLRLKRAIDVAVAGAGLVVFSPFLLGIAAVVGVTSRGPILFKQQRIGKHGLPFTIYKFRTMRHGTHDLVLSDPVLWQEYVANDYKLPGRHGQITQVGFFLRKSSLDELPQLFNVLRGDMSIVGVRPLVRVEYEVRPESSRALYASLSPGLTGLWQVEGRSSVRHTDRVELDDRYVREWTFGHDLALLARTPRALARAHHAE